MGQGGGFDNLEDLSTHANEWFFQRTWQILAPTTDAKCQWYFRLHVCSIVKPLQLEFFDSLNFSLRHDPSSFWTGYALNRTWSMKLFWWNVRLQRTILNFKNIYSLTVARACIWWVETQACLYVIHAFIYTSGRKEASFWSASEQTHYIGISQNIIGKLHAFNSTNLEFWTNSELQQLVKLR